MNSLFRAFWVVILSRTGDFVARSSLCGFYVPPWKISFEHTCIRTINLELLLTRNRVRSYSSQRRGGRKACLQKLDPKPVLEEEKDAFFVVRKGDVIGVYNNFSECQAQVGSSICDPPVSVYKGYSMPQNTLEYLLSSGLKNALYSIRAADLKEDLFGPIVPHHFQETVGSICISNDSLRKHVKDLKCSCILEFDGASKGNPGQAGAGAVLRADDGSLICRLREGLGIATNNVAEYRAMILGMKYALKKGFTNIRVVGDSKLVYMQTQGLWKVKNQNMSNLYGEAKKLKDNFLSFEISHILRDSNSEADVQANLAIRLADGQIQEEIE